MVRYSYTWGLEPVQSSMFQSGADARDCRLCVNAGMRRRTAAECIGFICGAGIKRGAPSEMGQEEPRQSYRPAFMM